MESDILISSPLFNTLGIDSCRFSFLKEFYSDNHEPFDDSLYISPSHINHLYIYIFICIYICVCVYKFIYMII